MEDMTKGGAAIVTPDVFIRLLEEVEKGASLLIDVRSPEEYRTERIEGARNVPLESIKVDLGGMDRDTHLLLYCKIGKRCLKAVDQLSVMGFHRITVLEGGIEALKAYRCK